MQESEIQSGLLGVSLFSPGPQSGLLDCESVFGFGVLHTEHDPLSITAREDRIGEATPHKLFSLLPLSSDFRPEAIVVTSGPGSYTGLRLAYSFVKGLAAAYRCSLLSVNLFELAFQGFKEVKAAEGLERVTFAFPLGRGQWVLSSGESLGDFSPEQWFHKSENALPELDGPENSLILLSSSGLVNLQGEEFHPIEYSSEALKWLKMKLDRGSEFSIEALATSHPDYGAQFSVLTLKEQEELQKRKNRRISAI